MEAQLYIVSKYKNENSRSLVRAFTTEAEAQEYVDAANADSDWRRYEWDAVPISEESLRKLLLVSSV